MRFFFVIAAMAGCVASSLAEKYLSVEQAGKLCFGTAERFQERILPITDEQSKAIEKNSGVRARAKRIQVLFAYEGGRLLGLLFVDQVLGKHELIDYCVAVSPEGKVLQVEVLEYRESYGREIRNAKWRGQFVGKSSSAPLRLNDDVYNISGATVSCRHVTEGIRRVLAVFDLLCRPELDAGRLPGAAAGG